jgi:hypothetical protein
MLAMIYGCSKHNYSLSAEAQVRSESQHFEQLIFLLPSSLFPPLLSPTLGSRCIPYYNIPTTSTQRRFASRRYARRGMNCEFLCGLILCFRNLKLCGIPRVYRPYTKLMVPGCICLHRLHSVSLSFSILRRTIIIFFFFLFLFWSFAHFFDASVVS